MNFGDPIPKTPLNQTSGEVEVVNAEARQKVEDFVRSRVLSLIESALEEPDKKRFVIDKLIPYGKKIFKGKENIFNTALEKTEATPYTTDEQFEEILVRELSNAVLQFVVSSGFSEQEAKIYFRRIRLEQDDNVLLDKDGILYCSRYKDKIEIHITKGLTLDIWKEAMLKLAKIVEADESIKTVEGKSYVVMEHKSFFRRSGFAVNDITDEKTLEAIRESFDEGMKDHRNKPIAEVFMTREEFLKRFSKKLDS